MSISNNRVCLECGSKNVSVFAYALRLTTSGCVMCDDCETVCSLHAPDNLRQISTKQHTALRRPTSYRQSPLAKVLTERLALNWQDKLS